MIVERVDIKAYHEILRGRIDVEGYCVGRIEFWSKSYIRRLRHVKDTSKFQRRVEQTPVQMPFMQTS